MGKKSARKKGNVIIGTGLDTTQSFYFNEEELVILREGKEIDKCVGNLDDPEWVKWRAKLRGKIGLDDSRYLRIIRAFHYCFPIELPPDASGGGFAPKDLIAGSEMTGNQIAAQQ